MLAYYSEVQVQERRDGRWEEKWQVGGGMAGGRRDDRWEEGWEVSGKRGIS